MLREMNLTYVIQDEVLLITTPEEADSRLVTKVYPVADLGDTCSKQHDDGHGHDGRHGWRNDGWHGRRYGWHGWRHGWEVWVAWVAWVAAWVVWVAAWVAWVCSMCHVSCLPANHPLNMQRDLFPKIPQGGFQAFSVKDDLTASAKSETPANDVHGQGRDSYGDEIRKNRNRNSPGR